MRFNYNLERILCFRSYSKACLYISQPNFVGYHFINIDFPAFEQSYCFFQIIRRCPV